MVGIGSFLEGLVASSEKAAQIARIIRLAYLGAENSDSFNAIATEEKTSHRDGDSDAKTLADVLCQSVVDADLRKMFPELKAIRGEENGSFQVGGADNLFVHINDTIEETSSMLAKALPAHADAVSKLSSLIHSHMKAPAHIAEELSAVQGPDIAMSQVGIWIDPIDATSEYVKAREPVTKDGITIHGLRCCTVLIGAYDITCGQPIAGVISRPFASTATDKQPANSTLWSNEIHWAYVSPSTSASTVSVIGSNSICTSSTPAPSKLRIAASRGESMSFLIHNPQYEIISPKGAGNKIMTIVAGQADLYVITTESNVVFRWDMCAGHVLLRAQGGGILSYKHTLDALLSYKGKIEDFSFSDYAIDYRGNDEPLVDGIVAYSDVNKLIRFYSELLAHMNTDPN